jgi:hypothetical protein
VTSPLDLLKENWDIANTVRQVARNGGLARPHGTTVTPGAGESKGGFGRSLNHGSTIVEIHITMSPLAHTGVSVRGVTLQCTTASREKGAA